MATVVITGANRSLGLEFARQFAREGWRVHAGCREPDGAAALAALAKEAPDRVSVAPLDVNDEASITAFAAHIGNAPVDLLINNAGVMRPADQSLETIDAEGWVAALRTNTLAPVLVTRALLPALAAGGRAVVVVITSRVGSIAEAGGGRYAYRTSKAAANMAARVMAADLAPRGITVVAMHPGWVRTDMGGAQAPLTADESIAGMRAVIARLGPDDTGRFLNHDGTEIPW